MNHAQELLRARRQKAFGRPCKQPLASVDLPADHCVCGFLLANHGTEKNEHPAVIEAPKPFAGDQEVLTLWLCESERLGLKPHVLYFFRVKETCSRCVELAALSDPRHKENT